MIEVKLELLDEATLERLPEDRRSVFILDWLIKLDQNLLIAKNVRILFLNSKFFFKFKFFF